MIRTKTLSLLFMMVFLLSPAFAQDDDWAKRISPEIALKAIEIMEKEPLSDKFEGAASIVTNFAERCNKITVIVDQKYLPWVGRENHSKKSTFLIAAFLAGNMKPQIISGIDKNSPYEGVLFTIKTYKAWRQNKMIEEIPELEKWSSYTEDQLRAFINKKP